MAFHRRVTDEDDRSGRRVERLVVKGEARAPREDDIDLLMLERLLRMLLHDVIPNLRAMYALDPERTYVERTP